MHGESQMIGANASASAKVSAFSYWFAVDVIFSREWDNKITTASTMIVWLMRCEGISFFRHRSSGSTQWSQNALVFVSKVHTGIYAEAIVILWDYKQIIYLCELFSEVQRLLIVDLAIHFRVDTLEGTKQSLVNSGFFFSFSYFAFIIFLLHVCLVQLKIEIMDFHLD